MRKKMMLLAFPALLFAACNVKTNPGAEKSIQLDSIKVGRAHLTEPKHYEGLFRMHQSNFLDCGSGKLFVLSDLPAEADTMYSNILPDAYSDQSVYMEMEAAADLNDANLLHYSSGIKMERKNYKNVCTEFDYWCMGTEPFWQVEISKTESLIDFHDPMAQKTTHLMYAEPEIKNGTTTYSSTDGESTIKIVIKKEKCNGAIDKPYDYSVQVELNGKKYNGCAIKSPEAKSNL